MTRRILRTEPVRRIFAEHGDGISAEDVCELLTAPSEPRRRLLSQVISPQRTPID